MIVLAHSGCYIHTIGESSVKEFRSAMSQNWHTYKIKRTLLPQQNGTKKFIAQYGDRLVCVRYRYNTKQQRKITTLEVVVDERPWSPDPQRIHPNKRLA
jgi:hypothetical protein